VTQYAYWTLNSYTPRYKQVQAKCSFAAVIAPSTQRWPRGWVAVESWFDRGPRVFLLSTESRQALGPNLPPTQGVNRIGSEADHSSASSTEFNSTYSYTTTPSDVFMAWYLIKHRDFTFILPVLFIYVAEFVL
jgi:hypothetical protein